MSRFHQSQLSSALVFALLCINSSLASPIANADRSRASIIAATEPSYIIPSEDLQREPSSRKGGTNNFNDGTTVTTTFSNRRNLARRGDSLSIVSVSEPVNIIPSEDLPQERPFPSGGSTTYDDGTTVTTIFNDRRNIARKRDSMDITSASEPVNLIPTESGQSSNSGSSSTTTNDGITVTTDYTTSRNLLQIKLNATGSVSLMNTKNQTLAASELDMGLNCEGSPTMCAGSAHVGVMHALRNYMYTIPTGYRYYSGQDVACMKPNVYPNPLITWGFYCAFMQGNIPAEGVDGAEIQLKMQQMIEHQCLGCGSVPFSANNDPNTLGILTVNYVRQSECEGLCYYRPPGIAANAAVKVPQGMALVS